MRLPKLTVGPMAAWIFKYVSKNEQIFCDRLPYTPTFSKERNEKVESTEVAEEDARRRRPEVSQWRLMRAGSEWPTISEGATGPRVKELTLIRTNRSISPSFPFICAIISYRRLKIVILFRNTRPIATWLVFGRPIVVLRRS